MAAAPLPLGLACFAAVKFAGYTAAGAFLKRRFSGATTSPWIVGAVRTGIGFAAGITVVAAAERIGLIRSELAFYLLLLPVRIGEWLLLLGLFFRHPEWNWGRSLKYAALGTLWSYLLDVPAVITLFTIPGGMWIC